MRRLVFALATMATLGAALPASAQWVVLDPGHPGRPGGWVVSPGWPGWWDGPDYYPYHAYRPWWPY